MDCTSQFARGAALVFYNSTSYRDDLLWAAAWMYRATREQAYLTDATHFYAQHLEQVGSAPAWLCIQGCRLCAVTECGADMAKDGL